MNRQLIFLPLAAIVAACAHQPASTAGAAMSQPPSVAALIGQDQDLSTFNSLVVRAGIADQLKSPSPVTVFAPTNDAFRALPPKDLEALAADPARLTNVIAYHIVPLRLKAGDIKPTAVRTAQGASLTLSRAGDSDEAIVESADRPASNGLVHTIDRLLMPPVSK